MNDIKDIAQEVEEYRQNNINFTENARKLMNDTINLEDFKDKDSDYIFDVLKENLKKIPFGDYLKRYLHKKSEMNGDYKNIDIENYKTMIINCFRENNTPFSFDKTADIRINNLTRNWLSQVSVSRQVIFLLGFGLKMSLEDVSIEFLFKAQGEQDFNFKDPMEIIYWYCFKNEFGFPKMLELKEMFNNLPTKKNNNIYIKRTYDIRSNFHEIYDNNIQFMNYLADFKTSVKNNVYGVTAYNYFCDLYFKCREIIADIYNRQEEKNLKKEIDNYMRKNKDSYRLSKEAKETHINKMREEIKRWTIDDITDGEFEKFLYKGTSIDDVGKLPKFSDMDLSPHFTGKILNRQRLWKIKNKEVLIDRFDLLTLQFLLFAFDKNYKNIKDNNRRFDDFIETTNKILNECSMGELYVANTYECFLLMCIISNYPFYAFTEVLGQAFESVHRTE